MAFDDAVKVLKIVVTREKVNGRKFHRQET